MFDILKNPNVSKDPLREQAIKKIKKEMEEYYKDIQINTVGELLINYLKENAVAEKILNPEKSIRDCLKKMAEIAATKIEEGYKVDGNTCVILSYEEGFKIILDYFEIEQTGGINV